MIFFKYAVLTAAQTQQKKIDIISYARESTHIKNNPYRKMRLGDEKGLIVCQTRMNWILIWPHLHEHTAYLHERNHQHVSVMRIVFEHFCLHYFYILR